MKKIFKFGLFSDESVCMGILITSFLVIFRWTYFGSYNLSVEDVNAKKYLIYTLNYYVRYFEPIVILIWLKFVCEFLYKLLKRNK